ncbi:MAG: geranylgeranylglyceryl/heptaprenylglyceryl phosphate synthase [Flavobacteriales bacterium]|nr:MAG: geranylgeranylglyceryl/heptaprenylglyceryl phosphate synthase [Flavobacteriales bacterium]
MSIYKKLITAKKNGRKLLAVLLDPEKITLTALPDMMNILSDKVDVFLVGGSTVAENQTKELVLALKKLTAIPIVLFPGDYTQVTDTADALLFLSLLSGRNPEYLIEQHVKSIPAIHKKKLEIIPTGYILIDGGATTAVQRVSKTKPLPQTAIDTIVHTALAGKYSGKKLIYLEAGSGAKKPVSTKIIKSVKEELDLFLCIGGGIRTKAQLKNAYNAGADMVVIGTALENNPLLLNEW